MDTIDVAERRRRMAMRQFLIDPAPSLPALADSMVGLHTSDPTTPFLAAQCRLADADATVASVESELFDDRSVVRMVGMRRTIFVVPRNLMPLLDAGCNTKNTVGQTKRLVKLIESQGIAKNGSAWIRRQSKKVVELLQAQGPMPGKEVNQQIPALRKKLTFGQDKDWGGSMAVGSRLMFVLASAGDIVRTQPLGSWVSGQYRWAATESWLGNWRDPMEPSQAQADLVSRWLTTYGPGTFTDIQWWGGWTKTETTKALAASGAVELELDDGTGFVLPGDTKQTKTFAPQAWMLPGLDPSVMAYKERNWFLGSYQAEVFDRNGNVGPTVWWDGRIVGCWGQPSSGEVGYELFENVPAKAVAGIESKRASLEQWFDGTRVTPRFPAPADRRIAKDLTS